jgi:GH25 family lysozyme M1 (1,4-beta-N-acetylmuramidase)
MALLDIVIDVSDAQGTIHWGDVYAAGIRVAMIKATQGTGFTAHSWAANSTGARAAGIAVIPYHFLTAADPAVQAAHFNSIAGLARGAAYALDWETPPATSGDQAASAAQAEAVGMALTAIAGREPLGYWGIPGSPVPGTPTTFMIGWDRWIPRYREGAVPSFTGAYASPFNPPGGAFQFWQYTCGGVVGGVGGAVDRSVASFDDANALIAWCGTAPAAAA